MLQDALTALERRCRTEAPFLLDDVRSALELAGSVNPTFSLLGDEGSLDGGRGAVDEARDAFDPPADGAPSRFGPGGRYQHLARIGAGGMGEVRRVRDRELNRTVAMKLIHADVGDRSGAVARFVEEVQTTAQLQHPGIVPVYDAGRLPDGRVYFTMKEVRGRTLAQVIREVHAASDGRWEPAESGWTFRRLIGALHQASLAVAFAHERGVVHRDLKPDNVMVGDYGEVQVMDWGLSKVVGRPEIVVEPVLVDRARGATRMGLVMGTPAYMAPEQARGDVAAIAPHTDVYALGAMLYEILSGRPPYAGRDARAVVRQVLDGPPPPLRRPLARDDADPGSSAFVDADADPGADAGVRPPADLPEELVAACLRAMARDPADRYAGAGAFAAELEAWLDGSKRRAQALEVLVRAQATAPEEATLRAEAAALRAEADDALAQVPAHAPEEDKRQAWAQQDEAAHRERLASLKALERDQLLAASLTWVPDLPEAHAIIAEDLRERHATAEAARDGDAAVRTEMLLRAHTHALPPLHPARQRCAAYLRGIGALTLVTDPPGAEVVLYRYTEKNRRLTEVFTRSLGRTPLVEVPLRMGSWMCVLRHPERAEVRYPVHITRQGHWDGIAPGATQPQPVWLPPKGWLGAGDAYVPAGWYQAGGGPVEVSVSARRIWCDAFVMQVFPVTNQQYLAFLDDLVARGREEEALRHAPRDRAGHQGELGPMIYGFDGRRFSLRPDPDGDVWRPDWPVTMVDWFGARAWLAWWAERTGRPWRLPAELEWEKAARGVDGRIHPWGDFMDASWCCVVDSHRGRRLLADVDSYPVDTSPYGIRGLAGNAQDWCLGRFAPPPSDRDDRVLPRAPDDEEWAGALRTVRGGAWGSHSVNARAMVRFRNPPEARFPFIGFRGVFSVPT